MDGQYASVHAKQREAGLNDEVAVVEPEVTVGRFHAHSVGEFSKSTQAPTSLAAAT